MALVNYSDSEASDTEVQAPVSLKGGAKKLDRTDSRKIKVNLPSIKAESAHEESAEPVRKRAKTGGAFSGFNSLLPAPKKPTQRSLKPGVNLKTSSEAAFSRVPVPTLDDNDAQSNNKYETPAQNEQKQDVPEAQPEMTGKSTRFLPLSVTNAKKKKKKNPATLEHAVDSTEPAKVPGKVHDQTVSQDDLLQPASKPRQSLFSVPSNNPAASVSTSTTYEPEFSEDQDQATSTLPEVDGTPNPPQLASSNSESLGDIAADLNLSASERRRLFGRQGKNSDINIARFDMDAEYRSNQELAAKGEVFEHRAVKTVAPGKHSLQQLVNNVRGQTDALEDKWAEGRRKRGEGGSRYGW